MNNKRFLLVLGVITFLVVVSLSVGLLIKFKSYNNQKQVNLSGRKLTEIIDFYSYKVGDYYENGLSVDRVSGKAIYFVGNLKASGIFINKEVDPEMAYSNKGTYLLTDQKIQPFDKNYFYIDSENSKELGLDTGSGKIEVNIKEFAHPIEGNSIVILGDVKRIN